MAGSSKANNEAIMRQNLATLKQRALSVKFDLEGTDYTAQENIGIGAYGVVCAAVHKKTNDRVAIKKIPNVFDVKDIAKRTYREIKILKHFKHDNVINIREILKPKETMKTFRDVYVVFDLMESDLHKIIYSKQELSEEHVRYFLYQILRGLKYIHSANVIHRDLKPSNVLVNEDCQLRIGDFGMARGVSSSPEEPNYFMTQYVATRWYRAPEIMLSLVEYGAAVDMWSVGCIFAEMLGRKHLFPGRDYVTQIKLIIGVLGSPKDSLLQLCISPHATNFIKELGFKAPVPFTKLFPKASRKAIHLLKDMLVLNPNERHNVEQVLVHPYFNKYHDPDDEPICVPTFNFDFEKKEMTMDMIRENIYTEVMEYHMPRTPTLSFNAVLRPVPKSPDSPGVPPVVTGPGATQGRSLLLSVQKKEDQPAGHLEAGEPASHHGNKDVPMFKVEEDDVFKRPLSAKNTEEGVRIDMGGDLLKTDVTDVEMLSAKSTDGKSQLSAQIKEEKVKKENREPPAADEKNKTISQDTKALIKAALLNASLKKQRSESVGGEEESKPKHVTAAQRQREREDKRKKKKEKTIERKRKEKMKKGEERNEVLTSEDRELLQRWEKMRKVNVAIAPKPEAGSLSDCVLIKPAIGTVQGPVLGFKMESVAQVSKGPAQQEKMNPSHIGRNKEPGTVTAGQTVHTVPPPGTQPNIQTTVSQQTIISLQQRLNGNTSTVAMEMTHPCASATQQHVVTEQQRSQEQVQVVGEGQGHVQLQQQPSSFPAANSQDSNQKQFQVDFSQCFSDLEFLSNVPPIPQTDLENSVSIVTTETNFSSAVSPSQPAVQKYNHPPMEKSDSVESGDGSGSGGFLQKLCAEESLPCPRDDLLSQTHQLSPPSQFNKTPSPTLAGTSPHSTHQLSPSNQLLPHQQHGSPYSVHPGSSPEKAGVSPSNHPVSPSHHQISPSNHQVSPHSEAAGLFPSFRDMSDQNIGFVATDTNISSAQTVYRHRNSDGADPQNSSSNSNSPPALSIDTRQAQLAYQHQMQGREPVPSTSQAGALLDEQLPDLVTMLSKQLSRQNVEDFACPPLALTPRGTGGGYGVGVDLDSLLMMSQDTESHAEEPSPLSSSILADWMEVTGNMNIDMEALEQELQSPMALSYNDLNLYSS